MPAIRSRGTALSSAILYLAIVAIWAGVLVPRWLHLRAAAPRQVTADLSEDTTELSEDAADSESEGTKSDGRAPIEWDDSPPPSYELFEPADLGIDSPGDSADAAQPWDQLDEGPADDAPHDYGPAADGGSAADGPPAAARPAPAHAKRRARVLRARRRMLAAVALIAAATTALAVLHVTPLWVVIPPALMLAGFLVLLREAAHTDAQRARQQLLAARAYSSTMAGEESAEAGEEAEVPAPQAPAAAVAQRSAPSRTGQWGEGSAQVIDISGRLGDQLYDQYTDAAERAVGD